MKCIVHGFQLHNIHCVWWQRVDRAHHGVAAKLSKDRSFWCVLGRCCDLVRAGTTVAAPPHRHTLRCHCEHWQSDVWRRHREKNDGICIFTLFCIVLLHYCAFLLYEANSKDHLPFCAAHTWKMAKYCRLMNERSQCVTWNTRGSRQSYRFKG